MTDLFKAAPHVRLHRGKTFVIKAGGGTIAKPAAIRQFARQVAVVHALGARVVVVHGGGPQTDALQKLLGEEPRMVDGRRVTTPTAMRALRMATTGELGSEVVAGLIAEGAPAVGASGASVLIAKRRPPTRTSEGLVDFGEVGDVHSVDAKALLALLDGGFVPVVCPPASDGQGNFLNVNADLSAASIAVALGAAKLVMLTGAPGILGNPLDASSLLSALSLAQLDALEEAGALRGGMRVKAAAIRAALYGGVGRVHVVSGSDGEALLGELYTNHGTGTLITREPEKAPTEGELAQVELTPSAAGVAV
jgi:acetylglutamate kinase